MHDGNCLFRALSEQTTGTSGKHAELRKLLLAFEEWNPQIFQLLVATLPRHLPIFHLGNYSRNICSSNKVVIYEATDSLVPAVPTWMRFSLRECNTMRSADNMNVQWIEILCTCKCHYASITSVDGQLLSQPTIPQTDTHIVLP